METFEMEGYTERADGRDRAMTILMYGGLAAVVVGAGLVNPGIPLALVVLGFAGMVAAFAVAVMRVVEGRRLDTALATGGADHPVFHRRIERRHRSAA